MLNKTRLFTQKYNFYIKNVNFLKLDCVNYYYYYQVIVILNTIIFIIIELFIYNLDYLQL